MKIPFFNKRNKRQLEAINFNNIKNRREFTMLNSQELGFLMGGDGVDDEEDSVIDPTKK